MKPFESEEIRTFLKAVDNHLTESFEVEIIGGAAAFLSFELKSGTLDIDTLTSVEGLAEAIEKAREETKLSKVFRVIDRFSEDEGVDRTNLLGGVARRRVAGTGTYRCFQYPGRRLA